MARLPTDQINRIKRDVSLLKLVESQGYEITKQGKDYVVHCPFHEDETPSCVISPKTNLFHCFGCGTGGSVIDWVTQLQHWVIDQCAAEKMEQADFRFSRREVRELTGWSEKQTRKHLVRLAEMEYVIAHRGSRGQHFVYELLYQGEGTGGDPFILGLLDCDALKATQSTTTAVTSTPLVNQFDPSSTPVRSPIDPCSSSPRLSVQASISGAFSDLNKQSAENAYLG